MIIILTWPGTFIVFLLSISSICNKVFGVPDSDGVSPFRRKLKTTDAIGNSRKQKRSRANKNKMLESVFTTSNAHPSVTERIGIACQNHSSVWCQIEAPKKRFAASIPVRSF
jgi:hypothetical protein